MNGVYAKLRIEGLTGQLRADVYRFLKDNQCPNTAEHCLRVGEEARSIAEKFGVETTSAEHAGYLHDISAVFPNDQRIAVAYSLGIEVLPEEEIFPMIIHQKLSRTMAKDIFKIDNLEIINAVGCHTTLRKASTILDKVLFVADKIAWDQAGTPPYINELNEALEQSLEHAAFAYINYLWQQKEKLKVVHPWLEDAYFELKDQLKVS